MDDSIPRSTLNDLRRTFPARGRHALAAITAIAAAQLAGCTYQPVPTYSYQLVPCPVGATPFSSAASPGESPPTAPVPAPAPVALDPGGTPQPAAPSCVAAVPNYDEAAGYDPYWDYGWPYYGGIGFVGVIVGDFDRRFHDHGIHRGFHDHDFHRGSHAFHGGGFHGGGFHGGGFHGGGRR
jgi:hypothetical protein